jgi:hypothetical protein
VITFETDVGIKRSIGLVFAYVADPRNFPHWNSAVQAVGKTSAGENGVGATYSMERQLPAGRAVNELEILAREPSRAFAIRTTSGPTPFVYHYRFTPENGETLVRLDAEIDLPAPAAFVPQLARRAVRHGVDDNLATLKRSWRLPLPLIDKRRTAGMSGVVLVVVFCGRKRKIARPSVCNERLHAPRSHPSESEKSRGPARQPGLSEKDG